MSSTKLRDDIRKSNGYTSGYTSLDIALSGGGLLLAGQTRPFEQVSQTTSFNPVEVKEEPKLIPVPKLKPKPRPLPKPLPAIKPKLIPASVISKPVVSKRKDTPFKPIGVKGDTPLKPIINLVPRQSGNPLRVRNFKKKNNTKGGPMNIKLGQYEDLYQAFEAGESTPFIAEVGSTLGELALGLL